MLSGVRLYGNDAKLVLHLDNFTDGGRPLPVSFVALQSSSSPLSFSISFSSSQHLLSDSCSRLPDIEKKKKIKRLSQHYVTAGDDFFVDQKTIS